ncbi:MAG: hypothetical protein SF339_09960, partial [Blastocatellia bacterium]|nr:hypothetical protein [Blastocatellia bacterium]
MEQATPLHSARRVPALFLIVPPVPSSFFSTVRLSSVLVVVLAVDALVHRGDDAAAGAAGADLAG